MVPPGALGMRVGHCPLSTSGAPFAPPPPHPPRNTCLQTPYRRPSGGSPAAFSGGAPKYSPRATCAVSEGGISEKGRNGASLGGVATGGDGRGSGCQSAHLGSTGGHWEVPQAELETFLPRGSTTRARVTPQHDDLWTLLAAFRPWLLGRAGGCGAAAGGRAELELGQSRRARGRGWRGRATGTRTLRLAKRRPRLGALPLIWVRRGSCRIFFSLPLLSPRCSSYKKLC